MAERIRVALAAPFELDGMLLEPEASIGIALAPTHGNDVEQLLRCADIAMYVAKDERSVIETYSADRDRHSTSRLGLLGALRRAIDDGELELHYQPKVSLSRGLDHRRRGAGPLAAPARAAWSSPTTSSRWPSSSGPHAPAHGATSSTPRSPRPPSGGTGGLRVPVAVNVSARDLHGPALARTVAEGLVRHGLPAEAIRLELTERILMSEPARVADSLAALDRVGVRLSLDDFGTGYSSLVLLQRLPVSEIKVDRSFVQRMAVSSEDVAIVRSIIDLAHALGIEAVAEGVETDGAWDTLVCPRLRQRAGLVRRPARCRPPRSTEWLERHPSRRAVPQA